MQWVQRCMLDLFVCLFCLFVCLFVCLFILLTCPLAILDILVKTLAVIFNYGMTLTFVCLFDLNLAVNIIFTLSYMTLRIYIYKHNAELQRKPPPANQSNISYTRCMITHGIINSRYTVI